MPRRAGPITISYLPLSVRAIAMAASSVEAVLTSSVPSELEIRIARLADPNIGMGCRSLHYLQINSNSYKNYAQNMQLQQRYAKY